MFQGVAEHWWEMVKDRAKSAVEELVKKFNEKYIPGVAKDKLALEFQELKQVECQLVSMTSGSRNYQDMQ